MTPSLDPQVVQEFAGQMALVVEALAEMLSVCHARLPVHPEQKEMLDGEKPCDVATDLRGGIECLVNDCLHHSARILREMGTMTDEELDRRWRSHRPNNAAVPLVLGGSMDGNED